MTLAAIAHVVAGRVEPPDAADVAVSAPAALDSRQLSHGGLFVALAGEHVDGHDFVAGALARGAAASLVSRPVPGPQVIVDDVAIALGRLSRAVVDQLVLAGGLSVIGLTGSSGKTGTKDLLAQVLAVTGPTVAPTESLNNELGVPLTALAADESTRYLVLELGARGVGHIAYLTETAPPRVGLVLNVGAAHVGEFGGQEATARAKSELVRALPSAASGGVAVLNADDPLVAAMSEVTDARVVTFGRATGADVRAEGVALDDEGRPRFDLVAQGARVPVALSVYGEHQVSNALGVAAVALELGMDPATVAEALGAARARSRWRMAVTHRADGVTVVNDAYNANPDSMRAGLTALAAMAGADAGRRRTWAVLGEMLELGAASGPEHEQVGRLARRSGVDRLVVVGDGARGMHTAAVAEGAVEGEESVVVADARAALDLLAAEVLPTDVVLVKASRGVGLEAVAAGLLAGGVPVDAGEGTA
ncbi:MAG: UDP-N-acetylmuramoyl-tripeptide--D-alanyl-D-alanine ligase [Actinomycetota bacterium]|nr:UDP-N-acetylmuramoyl-tripeptide--D-alanyl-D-alanine ligase [Actinomycetota bacterium]